MLSPKFGPTDLSLADNTCTCDWSGPCKMCRLAICKRDAFSLDHVVLPRSFLNTFQDCMKDNDWTKLDTALKSLL